MKGFILALRKARNEDSIVTLLTRNERRVYYRFFGARHSILQFGHLIDFEVEGEDSSFLPRLRGLSHIGFPWLFEPNRLLLWHNFIALFEPHLKEASTIDSFYYTLLLEAAQKWDKQNPKRLICESYLKLLSHEGRLHQVDSCYICETPIHKEVALMQAFIPAHPACLYATALPTTKIVAFFETQSTAHLEDYEVEYLFTLVMRGF